MTVQAAQFQLGRGILNSIITAFGMDSLDVITPEGLPDESVEFLRRMLVHYSDKDARLAEVSKSKDPDYEGDLNEYYDSGLLSYTLLNQYSGVSNLYTMKESDNKAASTLKYILGNFTVKEVEEDGIKGFRIYDKYDYAANDKYFKSVLPEIYSKAKEKGYDTSAVDGQVYMTYENIKKNFKKKNRADFSIFSPESWTPIAHPVLRTLGGWWMGDDMEEADKIKIDFFIGKDKPPALNDEDAMPVKYSEEFGPQPRPENFAAVIPNGPMGVTRENNLEKFFSSFPTIKLGSPIGTAEAAEVENQDMILPQKKPIKTKRLTPFQQAFADAKARGDATFQFENKAGETKDYSTEVK